MTYLEYESKYTVVIGTGLSVAPLLISQFGRNVAPFHVSLDIVYFLYC